MRLKTDKKTIDEEIINLIIRGNSCNSWQEKPLLPLWLKTDEKIKDLIIRGNLCNSWQEKPLRPLRLITDERIIDEENN